MSSGLGAGLGADMLQEILTRKMREAIAMRELAGRERSTELQNNATQRGLDQRDRGMTLDESQFDFTKGRAAVDDQRYAEGEPLRATNIRLHNAQANALENPTPKAPTLPGSAQEYEYAKSQGFKGTFEQYQNQDANRKRPVVNVNGQTNNNAMKLADDYTRDSKEFTTMNSAMRKIAASAKDPSAAGDMSLLYGYMKLLDPNSVVRETEFATAAKSGSLPQQIQSAATKLLNGQRLTPEQRADFLNRAAALYGEAKTMNTSVRDSYTQRAKKFGVDPSMVFTDIGEPELPKPTPQAGSGQIRYDMNGNVIKQ